MSPLPDDTTPDAVDSLTVPVDDTISAPLPSWVTGVFERVPVFSIPVSVWGVFCTGAMAAVDSVGSARHAPT